MLHPRLAAASRSTALDYLQLVRRAGQPVFLDGELVEGFHAAGDYEVADVAIADGTHRLWSDVPFGAMQRGWSSGDDADCPLSTNGVKCFSSYAHPVGLALTGG